MDGTFKSCSKLFSQIYTIHVDIGSTSNEINVVPVLFCLLPDKRKQTYERLFRLIKNHISDWDPKEIVMDFEIAVIISLKNIFPSLNIRGCNFHLNQCLWRKIQDLGLVNEYRHNEEIRTHLRMCASLAYIPAECVDDGWLCIQESSPRNARLEAFYDYFVEQWLENDVVTIQMWNCNEKLHRTNNIVEGWHHKLNSVIRKIHPKTLELIKFLKKRS
ncbi:uncharacterized protein LOC118182940 [Stegodyphus dumicola]|uniref:uncharacterized protein LOC118182940 n=1 Tax=Stegodyphus dumicola TaxID=202533 RepID=UPI0015AA443E|nr:uncharacterized protein LOC118182940 [Stegodyphus dumicola]